MNNVRGYNNTVQCPYNESHQILPERLQTHLVKCRKQYPDCKKVQCPLNAVHWVNEQELDVSSRLLCLCLHDIEKLSSPYTDLFVFFFSITFVNAQAEHRLNITRVILIPEP